MREQSINVQQSRIVGNSIGMFDYAKGVMMLVIIIGHSVTDQFDIWNREAYGITHYLMFGLASLLYYGLIPAFYMICGYGIRKRTMRSATKGQLRYFWKPYLSVTLSVLVLVIAKKLITGNSIAIALQHQVLPFLFAYSDGNQRLLGLQMNSIGPLWFFWVYAIAGILVNWYLQQEETVLQVMLVTLSTSLGIILTRFVLPWCIQQILICSGFMYVGWRLKKNKILDHRLPISMIVITHAICMLSICTGGYMSISANGYGSTADLLIGYMAGIVLFYAAAAPRHLDGRVSARICWIGRHAIYICCIHTVVFIIGPWVRIAEYTISYPWVGFIVEVTIQLVSAIGGSYLLLAAIRRKNKRKTTIR